MSVSGLKIFPTLQSGGQAITLYIFRLRVVADDKRVEDIADKFSFGSKYIRVVVQ